MIQVEEIDGGRVVGFQESNFKLLHEPSCSHPKIVPHHDNALHPFPIAVPQGFDQFRVRLVLFGMKPLLELVEDNENLLACEESLVHGEVRRCCL